MISIRFILPYFGKLPSNFALWLKSCEFNETVDFIVLTDDHASYDYPSNVNVKYCEFDEIKHRIQNHFDFKVAIDRPWKLSLFKPAYGEIFKQELDGYDFWGFCDADLMWGNIRNFLTDDLLSRYERVGTKGHASVYKNNEIVNARYKNIVSETANYVNVFSGKSEYSFDENGMDEIYDHLGVPYYFRPYYAHLEKYEPSFYLKRLPKEKLYTNKYQVFLWKDGILNRVYLDNGAITEAEYMYIHFFCRPMRYSYGGHECNQYIIYPDVVEPFCGDIDAKLIRNKGHQGIVKFVLKMIWANRKKISLRRIVNNVTNFKSYKVKGQ